MCHSWRAVTPTASDQLTLISVSARRTRGYAQSRRCPFKLPVPVSALSLAYAVPARQSALLPFSLPLFILES